MYHGDRWVLKDRFIAPDSPEVRAEKIKHKNARSLQRTEIIAKLIIGGMDADCAVEYADSIMKM